MRVSDSRDQCDSIRPYPWGWTIFYALCQLSYLDNISLRMISQHRDFGMSFIFEPFLFTNGHAINEGLDEYREEILLLLQP